MLRMPAWQGSLAGPARSSLQGWRAEVAASEVGPIGVLLGRLRRLGISNREMQRSAELSSEGPSDVLTAGEVAEMLRVTPAWVYAETRRGRIPHVRLGRYVRYRREALLRWMDQLEGGAANGSPDLHRAGLQGRS